MTKELEKGILTIAHGSPLYLEMAKSLSRSIERFSPGIPTAVVTDHVAELVGYYNHIIPFVPERGKDVRQKLFLDLYTPFKKTMFIDSDSIVFGSLQYAFDAFAGGNSVIPNDTYELSQRKPRNIDFTKLAAKTGLREVPGFNGGVYYVEKNTASEEVFKLARVIVESYSEYGLPEFRAGTGTPNDEYVLAIALAILRCPAACMSHLLMKIPLGLTGRLRLDVVKGLVNYVAWGERVHPIIVHFCGCFRDWRIYERECRKLRILAQGGRFAMSRASAYGVFFDVANWCSDWIARLWRLVPRPIRLLSHAVRSRVRGLKSNKP